MLVRLRNKLLSLSRPQKVAVMVGADLIALPLCLLLAFYLRLGDPSLTYRYGIAAPLVMAVATIPVFYAMGLYRNVVRYIDISVFKAAAAGPAILAIATYFVTLASTGVAPPRGSLFIYWSLAFGYVLVSRFSARALLRSAQNREEAPPVRVAIYGAGEAGFQLANALRATRAYVPMCFFDDDPHLDKAYVSGVRVHSLRNLQKRVDQYGVEQIIIAIPSASPQRRRDIVDQLSKLGVAVRTLPPIDELVGGKITAQSVRDIKVEDLLGRAPVPPMPELFARNIYDQAVLVTGAGGSIGSELCRQILSQGPRCLVLLDASELALYQVERELRARSPKIEIHSVLGSVTHEPLMREIVQQYDIHTIYHAAAYKHVPLVEMNPGEGVLNNVLGSLVVARVAREEGVQTCVLISTDKAVRPTNVMGASKRCAELIFQGMATLPGTITVFSMVRFGNVLGSSGSVVPLFQEQIARGGPITLTDPRMTRYFMLIPEAAQLVIQAGAMARGGEVFVLDMGEPVRILDLARTMLSLCGLSERGEGNAQGQIPIVHTGLRHGEKLYEELLIGGNTTPSRHPRINFANESHLGWKELNTKLDALLAACRHNDPLTIRQQLCRLVEEYTPYLPPGMRRPADHRAPIFDELVLLQSDRQELIRQREAERRRKEKAKNDSSVEEAGAVAQA